MDDHRRECPTHLGAAKCSHYNGCSTVLFSMGRRWSVEWVRMSSSNKEMKIRCSGMFLCSAELVYDRVVRAMLDDTSIAEAMSDDA